MMSGRQLLRPQPLPVSSRISPSTSPRWLNWFYGTQQVACRRHRHGQTAPAGADAWRPLALERLGLNRFPRKRQSATIADSKSNALIQFLSLQSPRPLLYHVGRKIHPHHLEAGMPPDDAHRDLRGSGGDISNHSRPGRIDRPRHLSSPPVIDAQREKGVGAVIKRSTFLK